MVLRSVDECCLFATRRGLANSPRLVRRLVCSWLASCGGSRVDAAGARLPDARAETVGMAGRLQRAHTHTNAHTGALTL